MGTFTQLTLPHIADSSTFASGEPATKIRASASPRVARFLSGSCYRLVPAYKWRHKGAGAHRKMVAVFCLCADCKELLNVTSK